MIKNIPHEDAADGGVIHIALTEKMPTPAELERATNSEFTCLRCGRKMKPKHSRGGIAYWDQQSDFRLAACPRCLKRKPRETLQLMQSALAQSIETDKMWEASQ